MVDKEDTILQLNITYENKKEEIKLLELLSLSEIKTIAMEKFKIPENEGNCLGFSYLDNENDIIELDEREDENLFEISTEVSENLYILNLTLTKYETEALVTSRTFGNKTPSKSIKNFNFLNNLQKNEEEKETGNDIKNDILNGEKKVEEKNENIKKNGSIRNNRYQKEEIENDPLFLFNV